MLSNEETLWDYSVFWKEALQLIRETITEQEWAMWFNNISYEDSKQNAIVISVPSAFYKDQVKQRYIKLIDSTLAELSGSSLALEFVIKKKSQPKTQQPAEKAKTQAGTEISPKQANKLPSLKDNYTFANFIVGENNAFAATAMAAKNPEQRITPVLSMGV